MLPVIVLVAIGFWLARHESLDWLAKLSEIASFGLAAAALMIPAVGRFRWPRLNLITDEEIEADAADLADGLRAESNRERALLERGQGAPASMRLQWELSTEHGNLRGGFDEVLAAFSVAPGGRLVILGESGSGKSTLARELAWRLVCSRTESARVPVVLPIAQWDPAQRLADWITDKLESDHPGLARRGRDRSGKLITRARALVSWVKVTPILDGLDEMPAPLRASAIAGINRYGVGKPLVVVSRMAAYRDAVRGNGGNPVAGTAELRLCDLGQGAIRDFLAPVPDEHWRRVFARLESDPSGALARALGNPLMLSLCRAIYTDRNPDELADRYRFGQRKAIDDHLLSHFVHAAYAPEAGPSDTGGFRCTGEQAQRWLSFLAGHSEGYYPPWSVRKVLDYDAASPDLSWWHLYRAEHGAWRILGPVVRGIARAGLIAALVAWILTSHAYWRYGLRRGPVQVRADLLLDGPLGRHALPVVRQLLPASIVGLAIAEVLVLFVFVVDASQVAPMRPVRLNLSLFRSLCVSLTVSLTLPLLAAGGMIWRLSQEPHHLPAGTFIASHGTLLTLLAIALGGLLWLPRTLLVPTDCRGAVGPPESLRLDRQADVVVTLLRRSVVIVILGLWCGVQIALAYGIYAAAAALIALVLGGQVSFASRSYTDACWSLGLSRRMPREMMAFLTDAESRGVLRAVGADYEFRHIRVQQQLHDSWGRRSWLSDDIRRESRLELRNRLMRRQESLTRLMQTAAENRSLAGSGDSPGFAEFGPRLALALTRLADKLHALGYRDDEVDIVSERTEVYRSLAGRDPGSFCLELADSLGALAECLRATERFAEAVGVTRETVDIKRKLAAAGPAPQLEFASSLWRLIWYLKPLAGNADYLTDIQDTVKFLRELEPGDVSTRASLAEALVCQAFTLRACGRRDEYDEIMAEALDVYRALSDLGHAGSWNIWWDSGPCGLISDLAEPLWKAGQYQDALTVIKIARSLGCRKYAAIASENEIQTWKRNSRAHRRRYILADSGWTLGVGNPGWQKSYAGYLNVIAGYQDDLAFTLTLQGRKDDAAASATESAATYRQIVAIYRKLSEAQPATFLPELANSLDLLAAELRKTGNPADSNEAEAADTEAALLRHALSAP